MLIVDIVGNAANIIYTAGSFFKKMLWLRISLVIGGLLETWYFVMTSSSDLWTSIFWNGIYILANIIMITILVVERGLLSFNQEEAKIYFSVFSKMEKVLFKKVLRAGCWLNLPADDIITQEGEPTDKLILIFDGKLEVTSGGEIVAFLHNGSFVGEMSFLTGGNATATVRTITPSRFYAWDKITLVKLLEGNHELDNAMKNIFSSDLIGKLKKQSN
ncbi:MAG: cyclic nucleotide-binding protein [Ignavibacteria bacterium]|nr:cyclic nucleotide-binding protein [Ignavibacteria bacterium]